MVQQNEAITDMTRRVAPIVYSSLIILDLRYPL